MEKLSIQTLTGVPLETITNTFNLAFSDYMVPVQLTPAQMQLKMQQEQIDLDWSAAVFHGTELVALILHGYRNINGAKLLYNAGTGVVPACRGQQYTQSMYRWLADRAAAAGIQSISLEVIAGNDKAIHVYDKIGFKRQRHFNIWKGKAPGVYGKQEIAFELRNQMEWNVVTPWWEAAPCWSASPEAVDALGPAVLTITANLGNCLVGYCSVVKHNGRLLQLSVSPSYRNKGIGSALLAEACKRVIKNELLALNVDKRDTISNRFFENLHWQKVLQQYEMTVSLRQ